MTSRSLPIMIFSSMPSWPHRFAIPAMALFIACVHTLAAQSGPIRLSLDGAVGGGHGWRGGERVERGLIATDLLVAIGLAGDARQGLVVGFEASRDLQISGDLLCLARPDGTCIPQYPGFGGLTVVAGYEWGRSREFAVRVLGGPGYYTAHLDHNSATINSIGFGARTDLSVRLYGPASGTLAARGAWVPHVRGQSYVPGALMIGLRLETGVR